jgi:hypothetical protein
MNRAVVEMPCLFLGVLEKVKRKRTPNAGTGAQGLVSKGAVL